MKTKLPIEPIKDIGLGAVICCPYGWAMWNSVGCDGNLKKMCKCECQSGEKIA